MRESLEKNLPQDVPGFDSISEEEFDSLPLPAKADYRMQYAAFLLEKKDASAEEKLEAIRAAEAAIQALEEGEAKSSLMWHFRKKFREARADLQSGDTTPQHEEKESVPTSEDLVAQLAALQARVDDLIRREEVRAHAERERSDPASVFALRNELEDEKEREVAAHAAAAARMQEIERLEHERDLVPESEMPVRKWMLKMGATVASRYRKFKSGMNDNPVINEVRRIEIALKTHIRDVVESPTFRKRLNRYSSRMTDAVGIGILGLIAFVAYKRNEGMIWDLMNSILNPIDISPDPGQITNSLPHDAVREVFPGTGVHAVPEMHSLPELNRALPQLGRHGFSALVRMSELNDYGISTLSPAARSRLAVILNDIFSDPERWNTLVRNAGTGTGYFPTDKAFTLNLSALQSDFVTDGIAEHLQDPANTTLAREVDRLGGVDRIFQHH